MTDLDTIIAAPLQPVRLYQFTKFVIAVLVALALLAVTFIALYFYWRSRRPQHPPTGFDVIDKRERP